MNSQEAGDVLSALTAAWPNQNLPRETVQLWIGVIAKLDLNDAMAGAWTVVREDTWFPSVARYLAAVKAAQHARANREAASRGLPSPGRRVPDRARFDEFVSGCRDQLAARGTRGHDHRGPEPCPVCGGMPPP